MLPGLEQLACPDLAVPIDVMTHVVRVESSFNPFAIGVVGGRLVRQPKSLPEALATVRMLEGKGFNFSLGLAQINRYNLSRYGLASYAAAFESCPNLHAGARILSECHQRAEGDWGKAFSCYYSGDMVTGFRHGYVQKVFASMRSAEKEGAGSIPVVGLPGRRRLNVHRYPVHQTSVVRAPSVSPASRVIVPAGQKTTQPTPPPSSFVPAMAAPRGDVKDQAFVF